MSEPSVSAAPLPLPPDGPANTELVNNVHPAGWSNPVPHARYNMVVVGGGTGGLVTAAIVAGLGGRTALVEEHFLGGDCLVAGCVPSKALLSAARRVADVRRATHFGVDVSDVSVDFARVMRRMRELRAEISHHDSAQRLADLGVDVFLGRGEFTGPTTIRVGSVSLQFARACIATGARAAVPPIPGLNAVPYLTNETLFELERLPARLGVIGGGPIGAEMAQAFARFGSNVTIFDVADRLLSGDDPDAAAVVGDSLAADGVALRLRATIARVDHADGVFTLLVDGHPHSFDALLVATGRQPNVSGLGLEAAGVDADERQGVVVDDFLRTTNSKVFAVGDVATTMRFTHAADFMARIAVQNALFFRRQRFSGLLIPRCTYTDPELAHVGESAAELTARGAKFQTITQPFTDVDRAVLEGETAGFARLHVDRRGRILGATIVGRHAGELINEVSVAIRARMRLGNLADVIHPYPVLADVLRRAGDSFNRSRLTPRVTAAFRRFLSMRR